MCPTGLTTITTTYTTTICPTQTPSAVPSGWTTTVTVCTDCGPQPTTLTLTKPINTGAPAPSTSLKTSTIYATQLITITACPPSVPNCPASSKTSIITTTLVPVGTTVYPAPASPTTTKAAVEGSQGSASPSSFSTSTVYETRVVTVTKCPADVVNCPASAKTTAVVTSAVPAYTTVVPVALTTTQVIGGGEQGGASYSKPAEATKPVYSAPAQSGAQGGSSSGSSSSISSSSSKPAALVQPSASVHGGSGSGSSVSVASVSKPSPAGSASPSSSAPSASSKVGGSGSGSGNGATNTWTTTVIGGTLTQYLTYTSATATASTTVSIQTLSIIPVPAGSSGYGNGTVHFSTPSAVKMPAAAKTPSSTTGAQGPMYTGAAASVRQGGLVMGVVAAVAAVFVM